MNPFLKLSYPGYFYQNDMWKHYTNAFQLGMSAWETIFYRNQMFMEAWQGKIAFSHPEFTRMVAEKIQAGCKGNNAVAMEMQKRFLESFYTFPHIHTTRKLVNSMVRNTAGLAALAIAPAARTAKSNATRLRKQAWK